MENLNEQSTGQTQSNLQDIENLEPNDFTFRFSKSGKWFTVELLPFEMQEAMRTQMIEGRPVAEVMLWATAETCCIYSFIAAGQGQPAWRVESVV